MNLNYEEAVAKYNSKWWEGKSAKEIVDFQLYEVRECMPLDIFQQALTEMLGRDVYTHEFADFKALQEEYEGKRQFDGLIPSFRRVAPDKPIIFVNPETGSVFTPDN